ncbi:hypothetical protein K439DRAFT_979017 [Ramaria rubella]|nr:hypothetical protein K439DRAFT_979017 [Ramaria rubella]
MSLACAIGVPIFLQADVTSGDVVIIWLALAALVDIIISISMIIITDVSETRDIISQLSRLTLQTGTVTSALTLAILVCFIQIRTGQMHTLFAYLLGKS